MNELIENRRPEVKCALRVGSTVWLGSADGLYRLVDGALQPVPAWSGRKISALGSAPGGMILVAASAGGQSIHLLDGEGRTLETLPAPPRDELKSALAADEVFVGGKLGIYRRDGAGWTQVFGEGYTEIIGLEQDSGRILAYAKKQGARMRPALVVSEDGGETWRIALETTYHDGILAERGGRYVTRWRGLWAEGEPVHLQKDAANAATFDGGRVAWIAGNKLNLRFDSGARLEIKDPRFAEAEVLVLLDRCALIAGGNGAFVLELFTGAVRDLFQGVATAPQAAKIKKLWALDEGRLLATASYGSFHSDDGGQRWSPCASDWAVLDAEGVALSPDGAWYLAAQRALFVSWDSGCSWKQVKLATRPHFAEMTAIAFVGDRLALGTKAGLFLSEPGQPKKLVHVAALGECTVDGLLAEHSGDLVVGTVDGRLARLEVDTGRVEILALFRGACAPLAADGAGHLVSCAGRIHRVTRARVEPVPAPLGASKLDALAHPDGGLIAWTDEAGWRLPTAGVAWVELADWPVRVKSVAVGKRIAVTDRLEVRTLG